MLNTADRCLHQYKARCIDKIETEFSAAMAQGNAAHLALARCYGQYQANRSLPVNLAEIVETCLRAEFGDHPWQDAFEDTLAQVRWPLMAFDGKPRVIAVERWNEYQFPGNPTCPAFRLRAKVDLVLGHEDGAIEHVDHKTGSRPIVDTIQNVASRIVVGQTYPNKPRIISTTSFLACQSSRSMELTREQVAEAWARIKDLVRTVLAEQVWAPSSNALCPWCPLYQRGCALYPRPADPDAMTDWLEGVA